MAKVFRDKEVVERISSKDKMSDVKSGKRNYFRPDPNQREELIKAGRLAANKALRVSKALGLSITYIENGDLIRELPSGEKQIVAKKTNSVGPKLKKGIILHAR
jgi:hypothetical protein